MLHNRYLSNHPQTQLDEILDNFSNIESESEFLDVLSLPAPIYKETSRPDVTNEALLDMFKAITVESHSKDAAIMFLVHRSFLHPTIKKGLSTQR